MKKITLLFALFIGLHTYLFGQDSKIKVACIGNSITAGSGIKDPGKDGYPAVLGRLLGDEYEVVNFGLGGRTLLMKGDRPYMKENRYREALNYVPDIVIIKLGTNDSKAKNRQYQEDFKNDMLTMIDSFETLPSNPKIYLCYPAKAYRDTGDDINDSIIVKDIIPIITEVAKEKNLQIIDLHTALDNMPENFPDKIHPNKDGAAIMAVYIYNAIKKD